jgi:D-alanyl-D-alanine dipeptidase
MKKTRIPGGSAIRQPIGAIARPLQAIAGPLRAIAQPIQTIARPIETIARPIETIARPLAAIAGLLGLIATVGCAVDHAAGARAAAPAPTASPVSPANPAAAGAMPPRQGAADGSSDAGELVDVERLEPSIRVEIRYATANNFTGQVVYPPSARCYLRAQVAQRLQAVQRALLAQQLSLKVFDCYRPLSVQQRFFALVPDERYVANPKKGSRHNRGAAIDLTLTDAQGVELAMPTAYDDFSERAHRSYQNLPPAVLQNRARLEAAMVAQGFVPMPTEWWHFDDSQAKSYPLSDISFEALAARR